MRFLPFISDRGEDGRINTTKTHSVMFNIPFKGMASFGMRPTYSALQPLNKSKPCFS